MEYNATLILYLESFKITQVQATNLKKSYCELCLYLSRTSPVYFEQLKTGFLICRFLCSFCIDHIRELQSERTN